MLKIHSLIKRILCLFFIIFISSSSGLELSPPVTAKGFFINKSRLFDANGNQFIMRGINHAHTWYPLYLKSALSDIADKGANCVRIVLSNGVQWRQNSPGDVKRVIHACKQNKLIAILEVHDTTGYGEQNSACTMARAIDYWINLKEVINDQEAYVIINLGNEPLGNNQTANTWIDIHTDAINRLRDAGFTHTLMVDAANWGQDWQNIMKKNATVVLDADPYKNVIFSVHMYEVYDSYEKVDTYMSAFTNNDLCLVVGEFGADHRGEDVDEASIMERAEYYGFGYMGWSWCGNNAETRSLDIINKWDADSLSEWGDILINGDNGLSSTSNICSVFR